MTTLQRLAQQLTRFLTESLKLLLQNLELFLTGKLQRFLQNLSMKLGVTTSVTLSPDPKQQEGYLLLTVAARKWIVHRRIYAPDPRLEGVVSDIMESANRYGKREASKLLSKIHRRLSDYTASAPVSPSSKIGETDAA